MGLFRERLLPIRSRATVTQRPSQHSLLGLRLRKGQETEPMVLESNEKLGFSGARGFSDREVSRPDEGPDAIQTASSK